MKKLASLAERVIDARIDAKMTQEELAAKAGVSQGTIGNVESGIRKRPRELLAIAKALEVHPLWLEGGKGPRKVDQAQTVSLNGRRIAPQARDWESLMSGPLEPEFETVVPDAAMAPEVPRGSRVIFVTGSDARPGDFVLVKDRAGGHYLREYRQVRPGSWEAHALNPAFLPMESERDGLEVLAIFDGIRGRRSDR